MVVRGTAADPLCMTGFYGNDDGGDGGDDDGDGNSEYHDDEYCGGPFVYEKLPWGFFGNDDDDFPSKWPAFFEDAHENINTEQKYDLISLSCSHMCLNLNAVFFSGARMCGSWLEW